MENEITIEDKVETSNSKAEELISFLGMETAAMPDP